MKVGAIYKAKTKFAEEYETDNKLRGYIHPFAVIKKENDKVLGVMLTHGSKDKSITNNVKMKKEHFEEGFTFEFHDKNHTKGQTHMAQIILDKSIITRENLNEKIEGRLTPEGLAFLKEKTDGMDYIEWIDYETERLSK